MRALAALPRMQATAQSRMTSRATIRRLMGTTTRDQDSDLDVPQWDVIHVELPFRLGGATTGGSPTATNDRAGLEVTDAVRVAHMPATTTGIADNDLIEITAGENTGLVLRVVESAGKDQATALRLPVIAVRRPEEWT